MTSPAIVGLNTFLVRLCHPIEGLGGLLAIFFGAMVKLHIVSCCLSSLLITKVFKIYYHIFCASDHKLLNYLVLSNARNYRLRRFLIILFNSYFCSSCFSIYDVELPHPLT